MPDIMTPANPRFGEFANRMNSAINFTSSCDHTHSACIEVLNVMRCDIPESIKQLEHLGGHCDCEVMMNVVFAIDVGTLFRVTQELAERHAGNPERFLKQVREVIEDEWADVVVKEWERRQSEGATSDRFRPIFEALEGKR